MSQLIKAQLIAANLWFSGGPKETPKKINIKIPEALEMTKEDVRAILKSPEYLVAVKHLMMITRTPKQREKWLDSWTGTNLHHLAVRMGLSWDDTSEIIHQVNRDTLLELSGRNSHYRS